MHRQPVGRDAYGMNDDTTQWRCRIRIRGLLGDTMLGAFPELGWEAADGETVLVGVLPDQASLHGVLAEVEALGLELIEVRCSRPKRTPRGRAPSGET